MSLSSPILLGPKSYNNQIKNHHYVHKISFAAIIGSEVMYLSDSIYEFKIFQFYNDFIFPIVSFSINLSPNEHMKICNNVNNVKFRLNLYKIPITGDVDYVVNDIHYTNAAAESVYKDLMLELSDYDKARFRDESEQYKGGFINAKKIQIHLELFKSEHLAINKKPITGIYNNVKLDNMLVHLLSKAKQKILIQKSNRKNEIMKQIVLPGKNLSQTIQYIQDTYGIYKSGLRLFFDFDRSYCLTHDIKENEPVAEEPPIEYKNVICYIGKSATETSGCYFDNATKTYYLLMPNSDAFTFNDKSNKDIYGNEMVIQSNNQEKREVNVDELENNYTAENVNLGSSDRESKKKYYFNQNTNTYAEEEMLSAISRSELRYEGRFKDIDTWFLTMNKTIYLSFLDDSYSDYNGMYEAENMSTNFVKIGKDLYETDVVVSFARLTKDYLSFS